MQKLHLLSTRKNEGWNPFTTPEGGLKGPGRKGRRLQAGLEGNLKGGLKAEEGLEGDLKGGLN